MVHELLEAGRANTKTGRELAKSLHCSIRDVTEIIERERRDGQPICAATGENPGYYLAADADELEQYCNQMKNRAVQIFVTRQALLKVVNELQEA